MVAARTAAGAFVVRRVSEGRIVFRGNLSAPAADPSSGDTVQTADFSALKTDGRFCLEVAGVGVSWPFAIAPDAYARTFYLAMRSFYGQRCGTAVDLGPEFPGYTHDACHKENAYHATSGKTGVKAAGNKGWHDAGDYGRYVVNSGLSTGTLLWTYEMFADRVKAVRLNIPESDNTLPDILDEIRWNLDWMLSMQDEDGGVFHKQTSERFCDFVMPEKDGLVSVVIGTGGEPYKSSCATADVAAVMAIAARIYLLGRNTFSLSWVTQVESNPFRHPHHRPSGADRNAEPWPGLLAGGPNGRKQDPAMKGLPDLPPAKMYIDDQESYASNEVAINWNAPLVFLLAGQLPAKK
jgi:endoglucanase